MVDTADMGLRPGPLDLVPDTRMFQVKMGIRNIVISGARRQTIVVMRLTSPGSRGDRTQSDRCPEDRRPPRGLPFRT
jgi:hypothetical protein